MKKLYTVFVSVLLAATVLGGCTAKPTPPSDSLSTSSETSTVTQSPSPEPTALPSQEEPVPTTEETPNPSEQAQSSSPDSKPSESEDQQSLQNTDSSSSVVGYIQSVSVGQFTSSKITVNQNSSGMADAAGGGTADAGAAEEIVNIVYSDKTNFTLETVDSTTYVKSEDAASADDLSIDRQVYATGTWDGNNFIATSVTIVAII